MRVFGNSKVYSVRVFGSRRGARFTQSAFATNLLGLVVASE